MFKKIKKFYHDHVLSKITNKLIFVVLICFIGFDCLLIGIYNFSTKKELQDSFYEYNTINQNIVINNFDAYMNRIGQLSLQIRNNPDLIDKMKDADFSYQIKDDLSLLDYSRIDDLDIYLIEFYVPETNKLYHFSENKLTLKDENLKEQKWYKTITSKKDYKCIEIVKNENYKYNIIYRRNIIDIAKNESILIVNIYINIDYVEKLIYSNNLYVDEILYLFHENQLFYTSSSEKTEAPNLEIAEIEKLIDNSSLVSLDNRNFMKVKSDSKSNEWALVKIISVADFNKPILKASSYILILITFFAIIITIIIILALRGAMRDIVQLSEYTRKIGEGDFDLHITTNSCDEIADLTIKFNRMASKIKELIKEKYIIQINEKEALLKSLEAQIDPHFLYNTLQAISSIAIKNNQESIRIMIDSLARSFRYKINRSTLTTIYEEIEYINTYITLCKLRFQERIDIDYDIDNGVLDIMVPRMLFQTLVENSVKYAVEGSHVKIRINIITKDCVDYLYIEVSDNGFGVSQEKLTQIRNNMKNEKNICQGQRGIGLANLYQRLKLLYGKKFNLIIDSRFNQGFTVKIVIKKEEKS